MKKEVYKKYSWIFIFLAVLFIFIISFLLSIQVKTIRLSPEEELLVADPNGPYYGNQNWVITLDGSSSTGNIVNYTWQFLNTSDNEWTNISNCIEIFGNTCSFDTSGIDYTGGISINLTVRNDTNNIVFESVIIFFVLWINLEKIFCFLDIYIIVKNSKILPNNTTKKIVFQLKGIILNEK